MDISQRAKATPPSPIRKLVPHADKAKAAGVKIFHLNIGQPDIKTPEIYFKALKKSTLNIDYYENSLGNLKLRSALANYDKEHKINVDTDEIIVTTGGSEAISFALLAACDPGDEVLVFDPCYANYVGFAEMASVQLVPIETKSDDGFHLPGASEIQKHCTKKTKAVIVTNPNNPTGTVYSRLELLELLKAATAKGLFVIADETYREFVFDDASNVSLMTLDHKKSNSHVILVDSF